MKSQQVIIALKKVLAEQTFRKKNDYLKKYNTGKKVHQKQLQFHRCLSKNRWVFGGNRSGKTECGAVEAVWLARGIHPYRPNKPCSGWVVSLSQQVQRDVAQNKILHYLNPAWIVDMVMLSGKKGSADMGIIDTITITNVFGTTSKIGFKSCDQGREKFQGTSLDFVWFDEEPPYDVYLECKMRVIDKGGDLFGTMTPLKGLTWVYNEIYLNPRNDPNIWHIHMQWSDNPFINQEEVKALTASLSTEELNSRALGLFSHHNGLVYTEFDEQLHCIEPFAVPHEWYDTLSIDPGLHNPLSCHWYAVDYDGNVYVIAEHYEADRDVQYHAAKLKEISHRLQWHKTPQGMLAALIDSAANQRTLAGVKSVSELFYEQGIAVNARVNKDLFSGINKVKSYFKNAEGKAQLFIFKTCPNLIREIKQYYWGENDVPVKSNDHALDELRYYIMNRPDLPKVKLEKTLLQKDKEKKMKQLRVKPYG